MSETLDEWYQRELDYFRSQSAEFARRFPKIADRLSMGPANTQDPHVERLIQAVAYLNARTRHKLDDGLPEFADGLLGILYPHMIAPIPSMSVVEFQLNPALQDLVGGHHLPRGTRLETERVQDCNCQFQSAYPVSLYPLRVSEVSLVPRPFQVPPSPQRENAKALFRISLSLLDASLSFDKVALKNLRFFVQLPDLSKSARLIELLCTACLEIVVAGQPANSARAVLPPGALRQVGFDPSEALLPASLRSFPGYRLLTEYFVFPHKFLFFELNGLDTTKLPQLGSRLELNVLLQRGDPELEPLVSPDTIRFGCTPVVNMFRHTADAIPVASRRSEVRIVPDARAEASLEVLSVETIRVEDEQGRVEDFLPFFSVEHGVHSSRQAYWHVMRRPGPVAGESLVQNQPTEMYVSLVDSQMNPLDRPGRSQLFATLTCFNRDIPTELARRDISRLGIEIVGGQGPVSRIRCLVAPTATLRRHLSRRNLWPLVSQLSLNHLSLTGEEQGLSALHEILTLNDVKDSTATQSLISGLIALTTESGVQRLQRAFVRGTNVRVVLDDSKFKGDSAFLFASVLNQFLAMYASMNSFTRLSATTVSRQTRQESDWTWPPQAGLKTLI